MFTYTPVKPSGLPATTPSDPADRLLYAPTTGDRVHTTTMLDLRNFLLGAPLRGQFVMSTSTPVNITTAGTPVLVDTFAWSPLGSPQRLEVGTDPWEVVVPSDNAGVVDAFVLLEGMVSDSGNSTANLSLYLNGQEVMSSPPTELGSGHAKRMCIVSWLGEINPGDVLELYLTNETSTSNLTLHSARMTVMKPSP
jgi:hypothetical protein